MSSRSTAKKIARPAAKPAPRRTAARRSAPKPKPKKKQKLAKVTKFPSAKVARKQPPARRAPPPAPRRPEQQHAARHAPPLTAPRQVQQPKQSLARSFYWSELRVGDDLPPLSKPAVDRVQVVRYASASGDFNRLHLDEPYAHQVGFPGLFAQGMLPMAFVGQLLTAWLRRGHVRKLSARFVKIVWPGDELTCHGRIAELRKERGACYADVELWAENQKGELVLRGMASCELYESPAAGGGDTGGLLFALQNQGPAASLPSRKSSASGSSKPAKKR
jgi:acyl dehydratase